MRPAPHLRCALDSAVSRACGARGRGRGRAIHPLSFSIGCHIGPKGYGMGISVCSEDYDN